MDVSLDDYITTNQKTDIKKRLGAKISPGKANLRAAAKTTKIAGAESNSISVQFDARQRIGKKSVTDARQKLSVRSDARQKLSVRSDARLKLSGRKIPRVTGPGGRQLNVTDARLKIKTTTGKTKDARDLIKSRQNKPVLSQVKGPFQEIERAAPKVTVTGLGRVVGGTTAGHQAGTMITHAGSIKKTFSSDDFDMAPPQIHQPLMKTIENPTFQSMPSSRVGNNIVLSPADPYSQKYKPVASEPDYSYPEPQAAPQQHKPAYTQQMADMPLIRIQNDVYRQPEPVQVIHPAPAPVHVPMPAPATAPTYYLEPAATPQHVNPMIQTPLVLAPHMTSTPHMVQNTHLTSSNIPIHSHIVTPHINPARMDRVSEHFHLSEKVVSQLAIRPVSPKSMQSRLGDDPQGLKSKDVSPLQGCRVIISNLHKVVTQDDIVELFGAVGALKKVKILRIGTAEVVFVKHDVGMAAIKKYNNRELDGQPMYVTLAPNSAPPPADLATPSPEISRIQQKSSSGASSESSEVNVDISLLHKALFKTASKDDPPTRPVTFTVKM